MTHHALGVLALSLDGIVFGLLSVSSAVRSEPLLSSLFALLGTVAGFVAVLHA